jgi:hypothetical protein
MNELPDDLNYHELKTELRILQGKIEHLNARMNGITPPVPPTRGRKLAKLAAFRWQMAIGFLVLAGAVAQTVDPITVGPDGRVRMGKSLDVAETVKAKSFTGDASGLTVNGDSITQTVAGKFKGDVDAAGQVKAGLAIQAGNSDIYFNKTDHLFTAASDVTGKAAIENSSNYNGLMILGRKTATGRLVRLWDRVGIGGNTASSLDAPLDVKGEIRGLPWRSADYGWTQGQKPAARTKMTRTDRSVCFLTAVTGYFYGGGERVEIVADGDGYWYLQGKSETRNVGAVARCIGAPDTSW